MPSSPKVFIHNTVEMLTSRIEEGLPLVPTEFMNEIIWSALATAQAKHHVDLIGFVFQANHFHMLIRVEDPEAVPQFVGVVKQEISHRVNHLLGRCKHTVWAEGYDSPTILDREKVLEQFAYVILNPVKDNIVETIEQYPGVCSASMFRHDVHIRESFYIPRNEVFSLKNPHQAWRETSAVMQHFKSLAKSPNIQHHTLIVNPYAWKYCFEETQSLTDKEAKALMVVHLDRLREQIRIEREQEKKTRFCTARDLVRQSMLKPYTPESFGKRMYCLSTNSDKRIGFIMFVKRIRVLAKEVWEEWLLGNFVRSFPAGLFPPGRRPMASILVW